jgi:ankyrin repeat protein
MKKSIVYLGVALLAFANVSLASNFNSSTAAKIEITTYEGITPLGVAVSKGDIQTVKKFIEYGADVNEKSNGMSPLMIAARYNKIEIIKILLSNGANLKTKDEKGFTALKHAELSHANEAIQILKQA